MATTATQRKPAFSVARTLRLLADHRCACPGCAGATTPSTRWPSWRKCQECECMWTVSTIGGRKREGVFVSPSCPGQRERREAG